MFHAVIKANIISASDWVLIVVHIKDLRSPFQVKKRIEKVLIQFLKKYSNCTYQPEKERVLIH